jgi:hypothetical protein
MSLLRISSHIFIKYMDRITRIVWTGIASALFLPAMLYAQAGQSDPTIRLDNPFKAGNTLYDFIVTVIDKIILPLGAVVVVLAIIYSGFRFVIAQGNESEIRKARENLMWVVIGAAVLLGSWVIARVVENTVKSLQ